MKLIADTHCHTIASTHAYSSLTEVVRAAKAKGLYAVAVTDHGYAMPGAPGKWYFSNLGVVPQYFEGVLVLRGAEANLLDYSARLDLPENELEGLDWVVASIHDPLMPKDHEPTVEECTALWLRAAQNPHIRVIGHSGSPKYRYDYERVIPEFGRCGKLVEINENSFSVRKSSIPNCVEIAKLCKKYGVPVVVNSDAHFHTQIGNFPRAEQLLQEIDFPEELVVNASVERFRTYLRQHTHVEVWPRES